VLSPFARAGKLDVLQQLTAKRRRVVPRAVLEEIDDGVLDHSRLAEVRGAGWLEPVPTDSLAELRVLSQYLAGLGVDDHGRNVGEAATLAWAEVHKAVALVDDALAVTFARKRGCTVVRTLRLITQAVIGQVLTDADAALLIDILIREGGARFPCDGSGFVAWAEDQGLLVRG
jgi:predicted nucleic acid-binding protein